MSRGHWVPQGSITLSTATLVSDATATADLTLSGMQFASKFRVQVAATFGTTPASTLDIYLRPSVTGDTPWAAVQTLTATDITGVTSETHIAVLDAMEAPGAQLYLVNRDNANRLTVTAQWAFWEEF